MVGELITLPLQVGVRASALLLDAAGKAAERALSIAGQVAGAVAPGATGTPEYEPAVRPEQEEWEAEPEARPEGTGASSVETVPSSAAQAAPASAADEVLGVQNHVSEDPSLVQEVAERGVEDGAGAAVEVAEPWEGYEGMTAERVIERLDRATPAELAAVRLYEGRNRGRETVLAAAERRLNAVRGSGSPE